VTRFGVEFKRKSEPFWKILGRHRVSSTILRVPITFPPEKFYGRQLSAMCTPDLRGTQGTHQTFRAREGSLDGPEGESLAFVVRDGRIGIQGQSIELREGEYTPWLRLKFRSARGIVRFLLVRDHPEFLLYATPVQIDPESPAMPISHPPYYAMYLARLLGTYSTLGMAEDTWAMNEGTLDRAAFLRQAREIQSEREAMYFHTLQHTRRGVVACVFDTTDRVQHMCFGQADVIDALYEDMDRIVGETLRYVDPGTALFVLSDHGFRAFRRGVNLNAWLRREGYLHLLEEAADSGEYFNGVDWSRTSAYTFGLAGVYINLKGREAMGIVETTDADSLRRELAAKLTGLRDGDDIAIRTAYPSQDIYSGPYLGAAPDVVIGYADGYRASWAAAVGKTTAAVFEDNRKAWCGDHCVDPALVPGVLFSNLPLSPASPGIEDMAATALHLFGVDRPSWMEGSSVVGSV
jgi:predicted AlkP superfamily phosphohydrolase/phosphomutase